MQHKLYEYFIGQIICSLVVLFLTASITAFAVVLFKNMTLIYVGLLIWISFNIWFGRRMLRNYKEDNK